MDSFKEFQGKSLDEAISEACAYFDTPREKLEIDILQDSKSGIFGLVGARKAKVRARRVLLRTAVEDILGRTSDVPLNADGNVEATTTAEKKQHEDKAHDKHADRHEKREKQDRPEKTSARPEKNVERHHDKDRARDHATDFEKSSKELERQAEDCEPAVRSLSLNGEEAWAADISGERCPQDRPEKAVRLDWPEKSDKTPKPERADRPERGGEERRAKPAPKPGVRHGERQGEPHTRPRPARAPRHEESAFPREAFGEELLPEDGDDLQRVPFENLDQDRLRSLSLEVVATLVTPIVGELPLTVDLHEGRVNVRMDCGDDSGLLIGREGQTLASLQYLASRMVSRGMNAAVRVQLDAGEYRLRQDEKLREMAMGLAEKVRATGKSHSTRPLSSYHRRIVHLVLQDSADVQTRSSGDGPLKRVVIQRKRG